MKGMPQPERNTGPREASPATIRAAILAAARPYPELRDLRVEVMAPLATATMTACPVVCTREQPRKDRREGTVVIQTHDALRLSAQSLVGELARLWRYVAHTISCPVCAVLGSCGTCRGEGMSPEIAAPASVLQGEPQGLTGAGERTPLPQGWTWDHQYPICASGPDRTFAMVRARDTHLGPAGSVYTDIRELRLKAQVLAALRTEAARLGLPWCGPEQTTHLLGATPGGAQ